MLTTLILWVYITFILITYGYGSLLLLKRIFSWDQLERIPLPILALLGLMAVNIIAPALSLLIPLGLIANVIILAGALALFRSAWRYINLSHTFKLPDALSLFIILLAGWLILENSTHVPSNPDTNLYHAQTIHWIESFRAVPGLGNLHTRLAYNSNWLVLNALFSFAFLGIQSFHALPGILALLCALYFFHGIFEIDFHKFRLSPLIRLFLFPITFQIWASEFSSPGTDLPVSLLIWVVLTLWLEAYERDESLWGWRAGIGFVLSLTAITFKVSAFPLLLLPIYTWIKSISKKQFKICLMIPLLGIIALLPWMVRNLIVSGYWIYPIPILVPLSPVVDWRMPPESIAGEVRGITSWARQFSLQPDISSAPLWEWMPFWLSKQTLTQRFILLIAALLPPFFGIYALIKRRVLHPVWISAYAGVLFWLLSVPSFRFGYGFLIVMCLLILSPIVIALAGLTKVNGLMPAVKWGLILYLGVMLFLSTDFPSLTSRWLLPESYRDFSTVPCNIGDVAIQCAKRYNQCGYQAFPCVPKANPLLELRGPTLQDGFRISPAN